ncbi:DNA/RNA nuclease SfsA [Thermodesulfomicrobium sp. WS]|uniref:DNA/RNA nuclease SfsA n=1 Tax=Thermodesulfomicrobium sp. WS TaxID=3004129 RepID=UPI0024906EB7|nr:DNA/RNA nuclease SfsA [Thermodesulfomicrobium sp. WS]
MTFLSSPHPLVPAQFVRREKRFLIHCVVDGQPAMAHTNNSGSMRGLLRPGMPILLSQATTSGRKLPYTLELVCPETVWIGVNTATPGRVLRQAVQENAIPELIGFSQLHAEVRHGQSRLDFVLDGPAGRIWVETKNVTLAEGGVACFPDAVTIRGTKHVEELAAMAKAGANTAIFFGIQRTDCTAFGPAAHIDPAFTRAFVAALRAGVRMLPYVLEPSPTGIRLHHRLPLVLPGEWICPTI